MRLLTIPFVVALMMAPLVSQAADATPYADANEINLLTLLPPPPSNDSAQTKMELAEILSIQVTRTKAMEERAVADAAEDVWRFADVIDDPKFTKEKLPTFAAFFDRVVETEGAVVDPAKNAWKRPRPHLLSDLVKPAAPLSKSGAYPSGHTTVGTLMGVVLSNMLPEKRAQIMARAWEYGENRVIGGVHYRSDVDVGRIAGVTIAQTISTHADFRTEFEAARSELRNVLGMR